MLIQLFNLYTNARIILILTINGNFLVTTGTEARTRTVTL